MMRIAVLAHVRHPVAPPFMGGMEAHAWHLTDALCKAGHDVTLFASGDSAASLPPGARLHPVLEDHYDAAFPWHIWHGTEALNAHLDAAFARVAGVLLEECFDVVHNNTLHRFPPRLARAHGIPMLTSLHIPPFGALRRAVGESAAPWSRFTVTSERQRQIWWPGGAPDVATVAHNGIDLSAWPYRPGGDGSAVWSGRIVSTKAPHLAAEAARIAGRPLRIFGTIENADYFDTALKPLLGGDIRYEGHRDAATLAEAYAQASVALFTPRWEEPFGLAAIEAMATGLPVAALPNGAVREILGPGGCIAEADTPEALARAIERAASLPPDQARRHVVRHYSIERMTERYLTLYDACIAGLGTKAAPMPPLSPRKLRVARPERLTA